MSNINTSGRMARKSVVKDLNGNIITLLDEADGGYIIRNRQVVNPEKYNALIQKEIDKREAAKAATMQVEANAEAVAARQGMPTGVPPVKEPDKVELLEKKVEGMDSKLNAILEALKK